MNNLNAIKHGQNSKLLQQAINCLVAEPELRAFLYLILRAAASGELPQTTRSMLTEALKSADREEAVARLERRLRNDA